VNESYWNRFVGKRISRRHALAITGSAAAAAAFLAACGGGNDNKKSTGGGATGATGGTGAALDNTKGTVGGKLIWQGYGDPGGGLELIKGRNAGVVQLASLTHDGLLEFAYGQPKYPGIGNDVLPTLSTALPEISPDKLTVTFKLKTGVKWHDGSDFSSKDVKWTYDTYISSPDSAWKADYNFIDSTTAPDATTFVMKLKQPNADTLQTLALKDKGPILNQAFQESGKATSSLMGTGPYTFIEYSPPTIARYKRNPNYHMQPFPYFDEIDRLGTSDPEKKIADIVSKQVHVTYWFPAEERERIKAQRKDLQIFQYPRAGAGNIYIRNDVAPFNDKRVRQALSMGYDRKPNIDAVAGGEGQADQALSRSGTAWQFRGPEELPRKDLYVLNVAEAKKLLSAAGVTLPLKLEIPTWNATVIGQKFVDEVTLIATQWRNNGLVDAKLKEETFGEFAPRFIGQYDTLQWGPNVTATVPDLGKQIRDKYFWDTGDRPALNLCYTKDPTLNDLVDKQSKEFDRTARIALFRQLEEKLSEDMVHISGVTGTLTYMVDPSVKNAQMPRDAYNGGVPWMKYWWFG
jgi:peptide/nickel transport system substrate-binding protein